MKANKTGITLQTKRQLLLCASIFGCATLLMLFQHQRINAFDTLRKEQLLDPIQMKTLPLDSAVNTPNLARTKNRNIGQSHSVCI